MMTTLSPQSNFIKNMLNRMRESQNNVRDFYSKDLYAKGNGYNAPSLPTYTLPPMNPAMYVNPVYMQEQPQVSPLQMLQQYRQTGQIPEGNSQFSTFTPPTVQPIAQPANVPVTNQIGGK